MSEEIKNISDEVMGKIHEQKIEVRPRAYFLLGSALTFMGLVASAVASIFLFGLMRFLLRAHGPMADYRFAQLLQSFPWWAPVLAVVGIVSGIWILKRYDFSYKMDFKFVIIGFIVAIMSATFILEVTGLNDVLIRRGPMRGMMERYIDEGGLDQIKRNGFQMRGARIEYNLEYTRKNARM